MSPEQETNFEKDDYIGLISGIMVENRDFLTQSAGGPYKEIADLMDDAIERLIAKDIHELSSRALSMFSYQILLPRSTAVYTNALAGNLSGCFIDLRIILEALAKCYFADKWYGDRAFFLERLDLSKQKSRNISRLIRELQTELDIDINVVELWGSLSNDWVHTKGFVEKIVTQVINETDVPGWALAIPAPYTAGDLGTINELGDSISRIRTLLAAIN